MRESAAAMSTPHDPFALSFDSIDIDPARAPARDAIERAMESVGPRFSSPPPEAPGFSLTDDAGGRFVVDREFGVISLAGEYVLTSDAGAVHTVRLRVVEPSGAAYELDMRLRVTGMIPRMLDGEEIDFLAGLPALDEAAPMQPAAAAPAAAADVAWNTYAAFAAPAGAPQPVSGAAPYGAAIGTAPLPGGVDSARLHLFTPLPPPSAVSAVWSI